MEGIRADLIGSKIRASTIYPGFIRTELNEGADTCCSKLIRKRAGDYCTKRLKQSGRGLCALVALGTNVAHYAVCTARFG